MDCDDTLLVQQCVRGDRAAYGKLVSRHQDRLFNTVARLVGNADDAADVVQEAFLNAYLSIRTFKGDSRFFTWLYRIAVNSAISMKRKRRVCLSMDGLSGAGLANEPIDGSDGTRPGVSLERAEDVEQMQAALNRLTPEHRAVVVLKEIEGHKYETIAEILEVPIGTVRSRLHRARLELRDCLVREMAQG